ncbi:hypothetical protein B0H14DRAFT_3695225 [Mycena olivaceomarginata]|nr:hypothetical protein B0H14DRAFT_3695225 [Mycena olivaceomarginata]
MELLINNTITVAWQLSVTPPTNDHGAWLQLRRLFGRLSVMTALHGTARLQRSYQCYICPSINHPTSLCPFPRLPGWLGPTLDTITALADASRQAAAKAQELIRGNTAPGPSSAHCAGGSGGRGNTNTNNKKARKDGGKGRKGGDAKGKGKYPPGTREGFGDQAQPPQTGKEQRHTHNTRTCNTQRAHVDVTSSASGPLAEGTGMPSPSLDPAHRTGNRRLGRRNARGTTTGPAAPQDGANTDNPDRETRRPRNRHRPNECPQNEEHAPTFFARKREQQQVGNPRISRNTRASIKLNAININGLKATSLSQGSHKWHGIHHMMGEQPIKLDLREKSGPWPTGASRSYWALAQAHVGLLAAFTAA